MLCMLIRGAAVKAGNCWPDYRAEVVINDSSHLLNVSSYTTESMYFVQFLILNVKITKNSMLHILKILFILQNLNRKKLEWE